MEPMKVLLDGFVGIVFGGQGKLSMHPKLNVNEEGSAEVSVSAIDDGSMEQCVELKTIEGFC